MVQTGPLRHARDHVDEILAGDVTRATASHQNAVRFEQADRLAIKPMIGHERRLDAVAFASELRRVEHDHAEPLALAVNSSSVCIPSPS